MQITAAVAREPSQPFTIEELELGAPRADEVLVRIVSAGICHTDLSVRDQSLPVPLPAVLGHEGAGIVEQVGEHVHKVQPGDHVVLTYLACGRCLNCQQGKPAYCLHVLACNFAGARLDGSSSLRKNSEVIHGHFFGQSSFATYALASEHNVVKVRQDVPLEQLGPLGCGIQTGTGAVLNSLHPRAGSSIAVFGVGPVGMSAIMAAKVTGCTTIIAVDIKPNRLALARELGATHTIHASDSRPVEEIQRITGGGANYTLETSGLPGVFRQAVDALTMLGVCGLMGAAPLGSEVHLDMMTILLGRSVRGIIQGDALPDFFIPQLIELHLQGRFPFDRLLAFYVCAATVGLC
jgi:aryl-alcohol dehydrogenase